MLQKFGISAPSPEDFTFWDLGLGMVLTLCLSQRGEALVNEAKCKAKKMSQQ